MALDNVRAKTTGRLVEEESCSKYWIVFPQTTDQKTDANMLYMHSEDSFNGFHYLG